MKHLPAILLDPFLWWIYLAPKKIFTFLARFTGLVNNKLEFTLNIKLLFVPLFGDYTFVGRIIGFIFRVLQILFGAVIMLLLGLITLVSPAVWWALPFILFRYLKSWALILILVAVGLRVLFRLNTPFKRIARTTGSSRLLSFTPLALKYLKKLKNLGKEALPKFFEDKKIIALLLRAELLKTGFVKEFLAEAVINFPILEQSAYEYARAQNTRFVEPEHLFLALLKNTSNIDRLLTRYDSSLDLCVATVTWIVQERERLAKIFFWQEDYKPLPMGGFGKGMLGRVTPLLNLISQDFTKQAQKGFIKDIVGRDTEIEDIAKLLSGEKVNILIIGDPGSGKTSIIKGIAVRIMRGTKYKTLWNKRIVSLETGALLAGAKTSGDIAQKLTAVMEEVEGSGDIILFIDEIHNLVSGVSAEETDTASVYSILEPYLSSGRVQLLAATNIQNYRKYIEPNGAFARLFQIVSINQTTDAETLEILKTVSLDFEKKHKVVISYLALVKLIELSEKLIHERVFPDKAIDLLGRAVVSGTQYITAEFISEQIAQFTKVPVDALSKDESTKLLNIESEMKKYVIGQDEALIQLSKALKRARAGIRDENRPIASFLFVGTTGVGKTETAKTLARIYFGSEKSMIRLDMSEYQQADSINKLIGTPEGNTSGSFTDMVRGLPFALILLDEIEKAHPNVLHVFLQVLDDARLTDTTGRVVDFTNTIIIATSNVGTRAIQQVSARQGSFEEIQRVALGEVRDNFAPEFLNRFNGIIVFRPLALETVRTIADLMLNRVRDMANKKGVGILFKPELINELVRRGYNPEWGARPLARVIEDSVETYLAVKLLSGEIQKGDKLILGMEVFE